MYICKLCEKEFKNVTALVAHLSCPKSPCKIKIKDYYDKFLRKPNEGICKFCGKETHFESAGKGYVFNVCRTCKSKNPDYIKKLSKVMKEVCKRPEERERRRRQRLLGENSPWWNPNREEVFAPYTEKFFDEKYREQIKREQDYLDKVTEQLLTEEAHLHHIDYNKQNDSRENLIWLNLSTHMKTNSNREEWKQLLQKINNEIIENLK